MDFLLHLFTNALFTSAVLGLAVFLFREAIKTRLQASVKHEFDTKLAAIQTELRNSEERFKADLRIKEADIQALQGGALSAMVGRQMAVDKRRLEAIDQLWAGFNALAPARGIAAQMAVIKFDAAVKEAAKNPRAKELFGMLGKPDLKAILVEDAWKARPYVSKLAWAYFSSYRSILGLSVAQLHQLQIGLDADILDQKGVIEMVKAVLPHQSKNIDEIGSAALPHLLEELEQKLLEEFQKMLSNQDGDIESIERAAAILKAVEATQERADAAAIPKEIMAFADGGKQ